MMKLPKSGANGVSNQECARIIAEQPAKYHGVLQEWAQIVLQKSKPASVAGQEKQPALFSRK